MIISIIIYIIGFIISYYLARKQDNFKETWQDIITCIIMGLILNWIWVIIIILENTKPPKWL